MANYRPIRFLILQLFALAILIVCLLSACSKPYHRFQGYVEGELTYISSPYPGALKQLFVNRGGYVTKTEKLFVLDPEPQLSQFLQAQENLKTAQANLANLIKGQRTTVLEGIEAQIKQTEANLALAKVRMERQQKLYAKNATSKDQLDEATTHYKAQQSALIQLQANLAEAKLGGRSDVIEAQEHTVTQAQAQYTKAKWDLDQKTQLAPNNALVFDHYFNPGEYVPAGSPVLSLLEASHIQIIFFIPEPILSQIKLGQNIFIDCDGCKKQYIAKIYYISPQAEYTPPVIYSRDSNYKLVYRIKAKLSLSEAYHLHPGQPVFVGINP